MKADNISFSETNQFSKLILDYIGNNDAVKEFYKYPPTIESIEHVIQDKMHEIPIDPDESIDRQSLVETIRKQYATHEIHENVSENIQSLENTLTFCIVTAHQLNIFGGPLYYIYKIAQTIATCRQLSKQYPNNNFVPVYWMGSEDHDFSEINNVSLYNKKIEWTDKQRGATGDYSTHSFLPLLDEMKSLLNSGEHAAELNAVFEKAYKLPSLTQAARYLVNALFGEYGLVVIDGNDKTFKKEFIAVMEDDLKNQTAHKLVNEQIAKLEAKGYKEQAFPREINLFYLGKNSRERIEYDKASSTYKVLNTDLNFSEEKIIKELREHPEKFSPNVILRPLYQQKILPSLAYIGGAGELSYWLQLKPVFEYYRINFPQLLLRNSALIVNSGLSKEIDRMGFEIKDFCKDSDQLVKEYISKNAGGDIDVSPIKEHIEAEYNKLRDIVKNIDASLAGTLGAELQKTLQGIDNIQKRLVKSLKQKNETELAQIEKIKAQLFPAQSLQERVENFSPYYVIHGKTFIEDLINSFDVYHQQFLILQDI